MKTYNQHTSKIDKKHIELLNGIYDVLVNNIYAFDGRRKLNAFCKNKDIFINYTENTVPFIKIGKNFYLYLTNKQI